MQKEKEEQERDIIQHREKQTNNFPFVDIGKSNNFMIYLYSQNVGYSDIKVEMEINQI